MVAVEDWRVSSARLASEDEESSDGSAPDGVALACANDVVAALTPSTDLGGSRRDDREAPPEMVRGDGASRTPDAPRAIDAWWFADAIVVVASATRERTRRENSTSMADKSNDDVSERKKPFPEQRPDRSRNGDGSRTDASTQHPPPRDANAPRGARRFWSSQAFAKSPLAEDSLAAAATAARQLGPLGADSTFVIVQDCESAREARDARGCLVHAGLAEARVFCLEKSLDEEAASSDRDTIGASFREWRAAWGRDRARRVARDYAPVRDCVRFWASFGTVEDDGGDGFERGAGAALKEAASASESESESDRNSMGDRVDAATRAAREALEAAHAKASLASLGSFLRTALEGLPRVGVGGAFDVARKNRGSDRAALATSLYGSSAFEYAAGFFLSWTVPGPLAAHAAHFTNRFRTAFACALLAGESPLDPRVVAAALAVCAGADGSLIMDATLATSERRVEVRRREEKASEVRAAAEEERERKHVSEQQVQQAQLAGARMDAAVCKSLVDSTSELRRRAMRAMRSVTDAGVDALREAEAAAVDAARVVRDSAKTKTAGNGRKRSETVAKTVGRGTARSESKPGEIEDVVERAFSGALARETARRVAVVVCGPMWLGATQADFTSMAAGVMSVYACNQSMSLFLPGPSCRGESAEDAAARRALTPSDGAVELTLDVDLDDDDDDVRDGDEKIGAEESPAAPLRRRALRVRVTLRPVPIAGGVMGEVNRLTNETRKGLDAAGRSITSVGVYAGRATMDGARIASRAIGEVGKNIAGAGEWIGASVTSVASNLASSGAGRPASDGKVERRVAGEAGTTVATVATEAAGSSPSPSSSSSSSSSSSFFAGIGAAARSPFASSSSNRSTQPNAPNQSASSVSSSSFDGPPIVKDVSSLTPAQVEAVISDPAVNAAIGKPSMVMKIMSDRKVVASLRDPRVTKAYMEFTREPCMFVKYKDDERVLALAQRVLELIAESGDEALIEVMDRHDLFQPPPPDAMAMDPREKSAEYDAIAAKYGGSERERNGSPPRNESGGWLGGLKIPTVTMPVIPAMGLPSVKVKIPSFGPAAETKPAAAATTRKGLTNVATGEASEEDDSDSDEFLDAESD